MRKPWQRRVASEDEIPWHRFRDRAFSRPGSRADADVPRNQKLQHPAATAAAQLAQPAAAGGQLFWDPPLVQVHFGIGKGNAGTMAHLSE